MVKNYPTTIKNNIIFNSCT